MSKNSNTVRREDLWILRVVANVPHREAVRRLDGACGSEVARDAAAAVRRIRAAARARQAETGERYAVALATVLEQPQYLATESAFPLVHPAGTEWSRLYGRHVEFERDVGGVVQSLRGVVLPPVTGPRTRPKVRVAVTSNSLGVEVGRDITPEIRRWRSNPSPVEIAAEESRWPRCVAGRPVYGVEDVPNDVLATTAALRRRLLRPGILQAPVATQRADRGRSSALYAIVDAEPIPAASPRQAAALLRRRTCAECGATAPEPFPGARDGRHYCVTHIAAIEERVADAERARHRAISTVWARDVANDDDAVLAALIERSQSDRFQIRVENIAGDVILDRTMVASQMLRAFDIEVGDARIEDVPEWVFSPEARVVLDRRVLLAATDGAVHSYLEMLAAASVVDRFRTWGSFSVGSDNLRARHELWQGHIEPDTLCNSYAAMWRLVPWLGRGKGLGGRSAADVLADMRAALVDMTNTDVPDAQLGHAEHLYRNKPDSVWFSRRSDGPKRVAPMADELLRLFGEAGSV